jgi:hypothetical protein
MALANLGYRSKLRALAARIKELVMNVFGRPQLLMVAALLVAAPAFAQTPQAQTQTNPAQKSQPHKQPTQDGNSPTTVGPASKAHKQKTQGDLPEVGPASGAYKGNVPRSQY